MLPGKDGAIVSIADHLANLSYLEYVDTQELGDKVLKHWRLFFENIAIAAKDEPIYEELKKSIKDIN